ncbi:hypothetical protein PLICRDRAFT_176565 [Plicaturopsis crispa FD-325 SS-3]|nr:hypothetical protein PLICRDRAFT_176565 [Plicaturopsis crispa FD-325 SS-3]
MSSAGDSLDPLSVPTDFVKEGRDWLAVFNPKVPRQMDVSLVSTFVHDSIICSVKLSPDASKLAVGSDGAVYLYDLVANSKTTFVLEGEEGTRKCARGVAFSPDGRLVVAGSEDKLIRVWSVESGELLHTLTGHRSDVYALAFTPTHQLVSASGDRTIRLWDLSKPESIPTCKVLLPADNPNKSSTAFTSVAVSADGKTVAAGSLDGAVRVWALQDLAAPPAAEATETDGAEPLALEEAGAMVERLRGHTAAVYSVQFVPSLGATDALCLVSGAMDKCLKRWDVRWDDDKREDIGEGHGERGSICVKTLNGHKDYILAAATVCEGRNWRAASASRDGSVRLWDLRSGVAQLVIQGHKNTVTSVDLSGDGKLLVSGSGDKEVRIWRYTII